MTWLVENVKINYSTEVYGFNFNSNFMEKDKNRLLTGSDPKESEKKEKTKDGELKTFTQEEVDKLIGAYRKESREAMEAKLKEMEENFNKRLVEERKEAERLAQLDAEERKAEEDRKREEELRRRDLLITEKENRLKAIDKLSELGVPIKLVDFVVDVDLDKQQKNIEVIKETFDKAVEEVVQKKLEGRDDIEDPEKRTPEKKSTDSNPFGVF